MCALLFFHLCSLPISFHLIFSLHPLKMAMLKANDRALFGNWWRCCLLCHLWPTAGVACHRQILTWTHHNALFPLTLSVRFCCALAMTALFLALWCLLFSASLPYRHIVSLLLFNFWSRSFYRYRHFLILISCLQYLRMLYCRSALHIKLSSNFSLIFECGGTTYNFVQIKRLSYGDTGLFTKLHSSVRGSSTESLLFTHLYDKKKCDCTIDQMITIIKYCEGDTWFR